MKRLIFSALLLLFSFSCYAQWNKQHNGFSKPRIIQYLSVPKKKVAWGIPFDSAFNRLPQYTKTINGGKDWNVGQIPSPKGMLPSSIMAFDADSAWVPMFDTLNGGGTIYATFNGGQIWREQSSAKFSAPNGFPNLVHFFNANKGVCVGDPNNSYFEIYTTNNAGGTWHRVPKSNIPDHKTNEVGFTNIYSSKGNKIWFGTNYGRVFYSFDTGETWNVTNTSLDFINEMAFKKQGYGIANNYDTTVFTQDGGKTWQVLNTSLNFSSFASIPKSNAYLATVVDSPGTFYSINKGETWYKLEDSTGITEMKFADPCIGWAGSFKYDSSKKRYGMYKWDQVAEVSKSGNLLKAFPEKAHYQWLNCQKNFEPVKGDTSRTFKPDSNGSYAVKVTKLSCTDTSKCFKIRNTNRVEERFNDHFNIYPNPTKGIVNFNYSLELSSKFKVIVYNTKGETVRQKEWLPQKKESQELQISLKGLPAGFYIYQIFSETKNKVGKISLIK